MISLIINILKIAFLLGFLVLIHEGGHFLVAKLCHIKVNEFAIGFGPTIWKKQGKQTKYALRLIPLGGFVSMEGEEERSEAIGSFSKASIAKRIAIVAAGGLVNIIFGLIVYFGIMASYGNYVSTTIDNIIEPENTAYFQSGDEIVAINNKKMRLKQDISEAVQKSNGNEIEVRIKRNGNILNIKVTPKKIEQDGITSYYLGLAFKPIDNSFANNIYYGFWDTVDFSVSIVDNLKMLFTGNVKTDQLMGPVGISGMVTETNGIREYVYIIALISLSLGVTNLLPFPPLDGGKIVLLIIEAIRKKPLKEEVELNIQMAGFAILIVLSLYITYNDVLRIF